MTTPPTDPHFLCCDWSLANDEPQFGTAVTTSAWFLLEYTRPWAAKANDDNELPAAVRGWLDDQVAAFDGRLQLIRQFRQPGDQLTFFVGFNQKQHARLYQFQLSAYEELLTLDMTAIMRGEARYDVQLVTEPHYFICTNGKRDRSCAVQGAALFRAFAQQTDSHVWMATHLGGHRFAPTLLTLPGGICYGRVSPGDIGHLVAACQRDELWLEKLRGRTELPAIAQVADYYLRQHTRLLAHAAFTLQQIEEEEANWLVTFRSQTDEIFQVRMAAAEPMTVYASSGRLDKTKLVPQYDLIAITPT